MQVNRRILYTSALSTGGTTYVGPGDISPGAAGWWGLRAYSAAYAASLGPAVTLASDQIGTNSTTFNVKSDGTLDVAAISSWVTANSVTTIVLISIADQSGNGNTLAANNGRSGGFPVVQLNVIGSRPAIRFGVAAAPTAIAQTLGSSFPISQIFNISAVYQQRVAQVGGILVGTNGPNGLITTGAANESGMFAGSFASVPGVADSAFHAMQATFNGSSSSAYVDGVLTSGLTVGAGALPSAGGICLGSDNTTFRWLDGWICEAGAWAGDQSSHNSALNSNQHTYWGF